MPAEPTRCAWAAGSELEAAYHDAEWGVPLHDDRALFEFLVLEGAQAGLSWRTILQKRPAYRAAFHGFEIQRVARMTAKDHARLMQDAGIVRNRAKIASAIRNAQVALEIIKEAGSLDAHLWSFVDGEPKQNRWPTHADIPAETPESKALSRDLKKRGMNFVGPTICYAFMQATGMVNDHTTDCFRHAACARLAKNGPR
jgi:DNA-3-methyladenine glycosylase I